MHNRVLPTPLELQSTITTIGDQRQRSQTADIERDADQYRREAMKKENVLTSPPLGEMGKAGVRLLTMWQSGSLTTEAYAEECNRLDTLFPGNGWASNCREFVARMAHKGFDRCPLHASID